MSKIGPILERFTSRKLFVLLLAGLGLYTGALTGEQWIDLAKFYTVSVATAETARALRGNK